jgi:hypothetical protein
VLVFLWEANLSNFESLFSNSSRDVLHCMNTTHVSICIHVRRLLSLTSRGNRQEYGTSRAPNGSESLCYFVRSYSTSSAYMLLNIVYHVPVYVVGL